MRFQAISFLILCVLNVHALAGAPSKVEPWHISSNHMTYKKPAGTAYLQGHVRSTHGRSRSWSDSAHIQTDAQGNLTRITLRGKPAKYITYATNDGELTTLQADTITDHINSQRIHLQGSSVVHHGTSIITGDDVWYNEVKGSITTLADKRHTGKPATVTFTPPDNESNNATLRGKKSSKDL